MSAPRELDVFTVPLQGVHLVEASAGTGKTWTLCALLLRLLLEQGLALREVLVVTFTKAATAELRERMRARLVETLAVLDGAPPGPDPFVPRLLERLQGTDPALTRSRLALALQGFDEAAVFTIHGFAQRSLAELGFASGQASALEALTDEAPLRLAVAQAWWRREVLPPGRFSPLLLDHLAAQQESPEAFAEQLGKHLRLPLARPVWPAAHPPDAALEARATAALDAARTAWATGRDALAAELRAVLNTKPARLNGNSYRPASLEAALAEWEERLADPNALLRPLKDGSKLKLLRRDHLDAKLNKNQPPLAEHAFFHHAQALLDALVALQTDLDQQTRQLRARWLQEGSTQLDERKAAAGLLGYDDMLARLHGQLQQPAARTQLRQRYPAALIDEFQDTDPLQYAVFQSLYADQAGPCFYVGDPKQAIYRFRQADLPTYLRARANAQAGPGGVWTLTHNQRSTPELLSALNALFGRHPKAFLQGGLHYHPVQAGAKPKPVLHEAQPSAALSLWTWASLPLREARPLVLGALAADIARRLHPTEGDRLDGQPLQARHIAVLVRTHRQATWVHEALQAVGVPAVTLSQASVWRSSEAQELQQALQALLGPPREDWQRALLSSVALGLNATDLAALDPAAEAAWRTRWQRWRQWAQDLPLTALLHRWLQDSGAAQRLLALPQGERRLTNWLHAIELLHQAQRDHPGPAALLAWLARQRHEASAGEDAMLRLESDAQRVSVVTIHRSKGLEYPLVYCPFAFEGERSRASRDWALHYRDANGQSVLDYAAPALSAEHKAAQQLEEAAESLRLHYVALTRAVLRCVVAVGPYPGAPASARAPLHALVAGDTPAHWPSHDLPPEAIASAWAHQATAPHTALRVLEPGATPAPAPTRAPAPALAALTPPEPLPALRWVGSFSRLIQAAAHRSPPLPDDEATAGAFGPEDFMHFPRGSQAGDCLHAAFEHALLQDPGTWPAAIARALREHPPQADADEPTRQRWGAQLHQALAHAARTPLSPPGSPFTLGAVAPQRQQREWAFHLHTPEARLEALPALLARHGLPLPGLRLQHLRGYLRGFVDLVLEHQGVFYVLDWKSNHLGLSEAAYRDPTPTVAQAGYALQALLYLLALHHHLRRTLPGYRPETHLGGAGLLFVRGLRPDFAPGSGQWWLRPDPALLDALDGLLCA